MNMNKILQFLQKRANKLNKNKDGIGGRYTICIEKDKIYASPYQLVCTSLIVFKIHVFFENLQDARVVCDALIKKFGKPYILEAVKTFKGVK